MVQIYGARDMDLGFFLTWTLCVISLLLLNCESVRGGYTSGESRTMRRLLDYTESQETQTREPVPEDEKANAFNKTIAAQFNVLLEKEFDGEDVEKGTGASGAGRSFSNTVRSDSGTLETVVRLHKPRGGEVTDGATVSNMAAETDTQLASFQKSSETDVMWGTDNSDLSLGLSGRVEYESANEQDRTRRDGTFFAHLAEVTRDIDRAFGASKESVDDVDRLIDSADNEFVISNPKRGTMELQQDLRLINDLVIMLCSAAVGGALFAIFRQPLITGYLVAGSIVGPGGLGLISELVQVETFAQFGIIFLLFGLGLEFNFAKLKQVQGVAVLGGILEMLLSMLVCGVVSDFAGASAKEGIFVGAFLSVSSTAVVGKCVIERDGLRTIRGQIIMGTLILQDCTIGFLFALIPVLGESRGFKATLLSFVGIFLKMLIFLVVCIVSSELITRRLFKFVSSHGDETYQLTGVAFCLLVACITEYAGLSMELGAFVAGVAISVTPFAEKTLRSLEPFRNIFAALFLTSIGLIMNPYFLWLHLDVLLTSVLILIVFKTTLIAIVVRAFGYSLPASFAVGASLAQVGELAFVLLSRASGVGLVERKLYLLLLGTTAISLVLTPSVFRAIPGMLKVAATFRLVSKDEVLDELSSDSEVPR